MPDDVSASLIEREIYDFIATGYSNNGHGRI